jgi:hypothetical protein
MGAKQDLIGLTRKQLMEYSTIKNANNGIIPLQEAAEAWGLS